ncbi:MAG TPA: BMP family ABC transporter substrate-binding protein [Clostridia bacterium]|nr:BMP family ABC transporter substrate-binding protein [Clostridia bacterium]
MSQIINANEEYDRARKRGLKEFALRRARGESGLLPVIHARREENGVLAVVDQPMRPISLNRIVGTYQASRANSFAYNFMPILSADTEFAYKWINLCEAHLQSGIRDPIRVYEYLWKYYVAEGNKRVSVLKYYEASSFEAEIIRLIPQWDENDPAIERYYTFLAYSKKGVFADIELSESRKYERLYRIEQRLIADLDPALDKPDFNALYTRFEGAYLHTNCTLSLGDAFLEYLHVYGFPMNIMPDELTARILTLKPQLDILEHPPSPRVVLEEDAETAEPTFFTRLLTVHRNPKIVFAYSGERAQNSWLGSHEQGRLAMQAELGEKVDSRVLDLQDRDDAYELLSAEAGDAGLLFVTTPSLMNPVLRFALEHPNCLTLVYSRMQHHYRLHTYFGRYYEAVFLCGVAAGQHTKTNTVAYVTPKLNYTRFTSDINAFAVGVRSVRPDARVLLVTRDVDPKQMETCENGVKIAAGLGADTVLTPHYAALSLAELPYGVFTALIGVDAAGKPTRYLAAPDWNWERFYTAIVKSYLNGSLSALLSMDREESPIASFWWGLGGGVVDVRLGSWSSGTPNNLIRYLKGSMARNLYNPFHGPVTDSEGIVRIPAHSDAAPADIIKMRYLVEGVEVID